MTSTRLLTLGLVFLAGCPYSELRDDIDFACLDNPPKPMTDMATITPPPKCAAAAGLAGTNLLCVDFDKVTQLTDPLLAGWNFSAGMSGNCAGWEISGGTLQVKNFASLVGNCGLTLAPIDFKLPANQTYQRATIALVHRVDMSDPDQKAQVFLDLDDPARLIHQTTSRPGLPTLTTTTLTVSKADLPMSLMSIYKFFLKASSLSMSGRPGWQIQSIAVNGSP